MQHSITIPENTPFEGFGKIPRSGKTNPCVITEKIDGTNAQIVIKNNEIVAVGSRKRWISPGKATDNYGFAHWVQENYEELLGLGEGVHFGEWYGAGIQKNIYDLPSGEKRFALFNVDRWGGENKPPECCEVVPLLYRGEYTKEALQQEMALLEHNGSRLNHKALPEGVIVWFYATRNYMKATFAHPNGKWEAH